MNSGYLMPDKTKITFNELILLLTAFAAGGDRAGRLDNDRLTRHPRR